ncbi:hypothetical protein [Paenirhodobacter sp.]|uniref:hypothetical protein n=1 Tax=Paenirhodobacter sp. TaxID=1965326 RepID=UPI003B3F2739
MATFMVFDEIDPQGFTKGKFVISSDAIISMKEVILPNGAEAARITTTEIDVAEGDGNAASYSRHYLVSPKVPDFLAQFPAADTGQSEVDMLKRALELRGAFKGARQTRRVGG